MAKRLSIVALTIMMLPCSLVTAKERSVDEFRSYASRRIAGADEKKLDEFVAKVDSNSDGVISDAEFAERINVYQKIFQTVSPTPRLSGHKLPDYWLTDFDKAREASTKAGKPVVAMFSASWCGPCKAMIANVYPTDEATKALEDFIPVYIDSEKQRELATKNDIRAFPTFICFDTNGESVDQHVGGGNVEKFVEMLTTFRESVAAAQKPAEE